MKTLHSLTKKDFAGMEHLNVSFNESLAIGKGILWKDLPMKKDVRLECYWVLLCTSGAISLTVDGLPYEIGAGTFAVFRPGVLLEQMNHTENAQTDFMIMTNFSMNSDVLLDNQTAMCIYRYFMMYKDICMKIGKMELMILHRYFALMHSLTEYNRLKINKELLTSFVSIINEMLIVRQTNMQDITTRNLDYLDRFLKKVALHHKEERKLKFYADALYITPKYLSTTIKETTGKTAAQWINEFVIQEARKMLRFTSYTVQEIAYTLNFPSASFFGKYFKQHMGMTPLEYRQELNVKSVSRPIRTASPQINIYS